jgi:XTP/dITP diphosphohydrolase
VRLLVATRNKGKVAELADLLAGLQIKWQGLEDIPQVDDVAETGRTFEENAILKATSYAEQTGLLTLADDSGLEVDALDGRPGVHTARYGGLRLTPVQRYKLLLEDMNGVPWPKRTARFRCVMALATPKGVIGTESGVCEGMIALEPAGEGGFGYDPIFYLPEMRKTMAQLPAGEKQRISHRGRAVVAITPLLWQELDQG